MFVISLFCVSSNPTTFLTGAQMTLPPHRTPLKKEKRPMHQAFQRRCPPQAPNVLPPKDAQAGPVSVSLPVHTCPPEQPASPPQIFVSGALAYSAHSLNTLGPCYSALAQPSAWRSDLRGGQVRGCGHGGLGLRRLHGGLDTLKASARDARDGGLVLRRLHGAPSAFELPITW